MRTSKHIVVFLLTLCLSGCLTPSGGGGGEPEPDTPATETSQRIAESLSEASRDDCVKLYGLFSQFVRFIESGHPGVEYASSLESLVAKTRDNLGWNKGEYESFRQEFKSVLSERLGNDPQTKLDDVQSDAVALFEELAAGCKLAAQSK